MSTNDRGSSSMSSGLWDTRLRLTDCFLEVEQTEEGKHSWELGEGDPCRALKERRRAGCFVAAGQLGTY